MTPTTPRLDHLLGGVTPGPVTMPTSHPSRPAAPTAPPAGRLTARQPQSVITDLATQLRALDIPTASMYTAADTHRALLSLPQLTIWASHHTLSWTHHGQLVIWPIDDTTGAAAHLAQFTHQPSLSAASGGTSTQDQ